MSSEITVVLPVHNAERTLRRSVTRLLDLVQTGSRRLQLVIVDDGSTDETYEAACELAIIFPQIRVLRQPQQHGLGAALEQVRQRLGVRQMIAHDGVGPIDAEELMRLLYEPALQAAASAEAVADGRGSRRFAAVSSLNARLADAHRAVSSFHWLRVEEPLAPRRRGALPIALDGALPGVAPALGIHATTCTSALMPQ